MQRLALAWGPLVRVDANIPSYGRTSTDLWVDPTLSGRHAKWRASSLRHVRNAASAGPETFFAFGAPPDYRARRDTQKLCCLRLGQTQRLDVLLQLLT
jgi:hypothetical protein